jgi:HK97 family phage major capsid protein
MTAAALDRARGAVQDLQRALGLVKPKASDMANYSLTRAIQRSMSGATSEAPYESFIDHEYEAAGFKRQMRGSMFVPARALLRHLDTTGMHTLQPYQTTVSTAGAELVETDVPPDLFIDALRPRSVLLQLGAQSVNGLVGNVTLPRRQTTGTAYWLATSGSPVQSGAITESEGTFDGSPLTVAPCQVGAQGIVSRLLLQNTQTALSDRIIAQDVTSVLGTAIDAAGIQGSGSGGTPTGIVNLSGVFSTFGTTFANLTAITAVQNVAAANAIISRRALGWATTPAMAGLLMGRMKVATNSYSPIWEGSLDTGIINGHPALSSTNVPAATAVFGDWSQMLVLGWGPDAPIEVAANPFAAFSSGSVVIRAMAAVNIVFRHPQSFTVVGSIS